MLNKKTKYAFHALTFIGKQNPENRVQVKDISKETNISKKFLESILLDLKNAGILQSKSGKGGGYSLNKTPKEIELATIFRMFNGPIALLSCASLNYYQSCDDCKNEVECGLRKIMMQVRDETLKILQNKTLQHIIDLEINPNNKPQTTDYK
ncbi:MAG: Rrf2 family transcriptional regulator [Flavobacteriales bacterium]|nr:Rrf2 family transcriptional regulator [Flavobacteriales bacterium]